MDDPDEPARRAAACAPSAGPKVTEPAVPEGEGEDDPLTLWFLSLTPTQRVAVAQDFLDSARRLRDGLRS